MHRIWNANDLNVEYRITNNAFCTVDISFVVIMLTHHDVFFVEALVIYQLFIMPFFLSEFANEVFCGDKTGNYLNQFPISCESRPPLSRLNMWISANTKTNLR